ncbi:MAG TPA: D-2-hydroxyacid dehydrogenase [Clostridia bacterium]|nr:D-2-hydroxyacid dehydrogenase [Clostridia bacterium]
MKLVVLDGHALNPGDLSWDELRKFGQLTVYPRTKKEDVKKRIADASIVFTNKTPIDEKALEDSKVRFISVLATGYNIVDIQAAKARGIIISNVPSYGTLTVAQFATAMMLELSHQVGRHSKSVHRGDWTRSDDWTYLLSPQIELAGKTLGLFGLGRIGLAFAKIAEALGMEIIYHSRSKKDVPYSFVSLEDLFKESDFLSLHSSLNKQSLGVVNENTLGLMKKTAFIINCSRGPLIVEEDLVNALKKGLLAGAALDVVNLEPMEKDSPLLGVENLILTPHIAWSTREARKRIMDSSLDNLKAFLEGRPIHEV